MSRNINHTLIERAEIGINSIYQQIEAIKADIKAVPFNTETANDIKRAQKQIEQIEAGTDAILDALKHLIAVAQNAPDRDTVNELKTMCAQYRAMLTRRGINPNNSHYEYANIGDFKARTHV